MSYDEFLRGVRAVTAPARRAAVHGRAPRLRGRTRTPTGRSRRPRRSSTRATARSRSGSPTARSSACARSTTGSTCSAAGPPRDLDPPVLAALRIAGYELAWSEAPAARRRQRRGRARPRAPACARDRVHERGRAPPRRGLPARSSPSLPPGPLAESYPDWIYEIWVRDWGAEEALALMRAQNEPAELVVRSDVPVGEPTDVPGAYRLERGSLEGADEGRIWQSRGSQLAALAVGSRDGERILDACAAPGAKATMLQRRGDRGRAPPRPRPRARGERRAASA